MLGVKIEKDTNLINLTNQVMDLMKSVADENDQLVGFIPSVQNSSGKLCSALSFEEALKELIQIKKDNNI